MELQKLIISTAIGLLFIGIGFLVKKYPDLIAGYNTMSEERKKNVDIDGLSSWMKMGFILIGLLIIILGLASITLGYNSKIHQSIVLVLLPIVGIVIMAIGAKRYDRS